MDLDIRTPTPPSAEKEHGYGLPLPKVQFPSSPFQTWRATACSLRAFLGGPCLAGTVGTSDPLRVSSCLRLEPRQHSFLKLSTEHAQE